MQKSGTGYINPMYSICFQNKKKYQKSRYQEFVSKKVPKDLSSKLEGKKWPSILGTNQFIKLVKEHFFPDKIDKEIPESLVLTPDKDDILTTVCEYYDISSISKLLPSKRSVFNEPRNVAIYLMRRLRQDRLEEIGKNFQLNRHSSVNAAIERLKKEMKRNRSLKKRVAQLTELLTKRQ